MKKSTLVLAVVFIILIIAVLLTQKGPRVERGNLASSLAELDTLSVTKIQIMKPAETVTFERSGEQWAITSPVAYRANQDLVNMMLKSFVGLAVESSISENPQKHVLFQVDSSATQIAFYAGEKELTSLVVGKTSPDRSHTYVRQAGDDAVYLVKGMLSGQLNKNLDGWRDKTIFKAEKTDITQITLVYPQERIVLDWNGSDWMMTGGGQANLAVDQTMVDKMLTTLSNFQASSFPRAEELQSVHFNVPDFRVELTTVNGLATLRLVEEKEKNRFFVQKEGDETIYLVSRGALNTIMKKVEDLKAKEGQTPPSQPSMELQ